MKKAQFVAFANFHGVNILIMTNFKLSVCHHCMENLGNIHTNGTLGLVRASSSTSLECEKFGKQGKGLKKKKKHNIAAGKKNQF